MMTYEFGDYKVKTHHKKYLFSDEWLSYLYYKGNLFQTIAFNNSEIRALEKAGYYINEHKRVLKSLANV